MTTPELMTVDDVADVLGNGRTTIYRWIANGLLPVVVLPNGHYRIRRDDLNAMLTSAPVGDR